MALLDHCNSHLERGYGRSFLGAWAVTMARYLNKSGLPSGYRAVPLVSRFEPRKRDVAAVWETNATQSSNDFPRWIPNEPTLAIAVDWPSIDDVRVEILADNGDPSLAAAIELVTPGNKDCPTSRAAFASKCADHLRRGCGLVVVDVIAISEFSTCLDVLEKLDVDSNQVHMTSRALSVVCYRSTNDNGKGQLLAWPTELRIGQLLPTVPLWLESEFVMPLDLEASYSATCKDLRISEM